MVVVRATHRSGVYLYNEAKIREIRLLFSYGFNAAEVAEMMNIHRVTVQRYRKMLKAKYLMDVKL